MASTYIVKSFSVPYASAQYMLTVFNPTGSGKIVRIYRVWVENNGFTAVTGVSPILKLYRATAASGGVTVTPITYDSTNTALGTIACGSKQTVTASSLFGNRVVSNDEAVPNTATCDEWMQFIPMTELLNVGTRNTNLDPIVCRENQGFTIQNSTATSVSGIDVFIEFTVGTS